jgi:AraC-like DNA-binding protein
VVLLRPKTPHWIAVAPDLYYRRVNVLFYHDFINDSIPEWKNLMDLFGENGRILQITPEQCAEYQQLIAQIEKDTSPFRRQMLLLCYLSKLSERLNHDVPKQIVPSYVIEAMTYINANYQKKIVASELAWNLHIGRTTLMTAFKKYTGTTLNEYIARCRLKNAIVAMRQGKKEQQIAEECGFTDLCNMIRCFKRYFRMTPKQYLASLNRPSGETPNSGN